MDSGELAASSFIKNASGSADLREPEGCRAESRQRFEPDRQGGAEPDLGFRLASGDLTFELGEETRRSPRVVAGLISDWQ